MKDIIKKENLFLAIALMVSAAMYGVLAVSPIGAYQNMSIVFIALAVMHLIALVQLNKKTLNVSTTHCLFVFGGISVVMAFVMKSDASYLMMLMGLILSFSAGFKRDLLAEQA